LSRWLLYPWRGDAHTHHQVTHPNER
jgi:hypothetical protein